MSFICITKHSNSASTITIYISNNVIKDSYSYTSLLNCRYFICVDLLFFLSSESSSIGRMMAPSFVRTRGSVSLTCDDWGIHVLPIGARMLASNDFTLVKGNGRAFTLRRKQYKDVSQLVIGAVLEGSTGPSFRHLEFTEPLLMMNYIT